MHTLFSNCYSLYLSQRKWELTHTCHTRGKGSKKTKQKNKTMFTSSSGDKQEIITSQKQIRGKEKSQKAMGTKSRQCTDTEMEEGKSEREISVVKA